MIICILGQKDIFLPFRDWNRHTSCGVSSGSLESQVYIDFNLVYDRTGYYISDS